MTMGMALGDGLLQEVWCFLDSSVDEGSTRKSLVVKDLPTKAAEDTGSRELEGKFQNHHQQWCVLSQQIYTFILKWNMNITFSKILKDFTVQLSISSHVTM